MFAGSLKSNRCFWVAMCCVLVFGSLSAKGDDPVFSGPQVGEKLPAFPIESIAGKKLDIVENAGEKPVVLVVLHKKTRPAFGFSRALMQYCVEKKEKLSSAIVFLSNDNVEAKKWLNSISRYFPEDAMVGTSPDGIDGPGAYGLNRKVELTIIVAAEKKVLANFALTQPSNKVDGPKVIAAVAKVIKDSKVDANKYFGDQRRRVAKNPELGMLFRSLLDSSTSDEEIKSTIAKIEAMLKRNKRLGTQLAAMSKRISGTERMDSIENEMIQSKISKWAKLGAAMNSNSRPNTDPELTGMMRALIQKSNSDEEVAENAKKIETYIAKNQAARKEVARISRTIANSDRLENYGTKKAQEYLVKWAKELNKDQ